MTTEQKQAIERFARVQGRHWRAKLAQCWSNACYTGVPSADRAPLQQLRNAQGPSWLARVKVSA